MRESGLTVLFLSINSPGSAGDDAMNQAAKSLGESVITMTADRADVNKLIRKAASAPVKSNGELGDRWQEAGWWLVPILALIFAASFRRETSNEEVTA